MAVKMVDIANRAGVSRTTVSLVLNDKVNSGCKISEKTVERVRRIAEEMGYVRNRMAAGLINQQSHMIGLLQGRLETKRGGVVCDAISQVISPTYNCVIAVHNYDEEVEGAHLRSFVECRLGGVIAHWSGNPNTVELYRELVERHKIPLVAVGDPIVGLDVPSIGSDHYSVANVSVKALLELGHRNIVYASCGAERCCDVLNRKGYRRAMEDAGLEANIKVLRPKTVVIDSLKENAPELMEVYANEVIDFVQNVAPETTAVVGQGDPLAYEILYVCKMRGVPVPERLSVIGFGDDAASAQKLVSLSSTCSDNYTRLGTEAGQMLLDMIAGKEVDPIVRTLPVKVQLRGTTGKPGM